MNIAATDKLVVVEFSRLDPNRKRSRTQQYGSCWVCPVSVPFKCDAAPDALSDAIYEVGIRLARDEADLDRDWQSYFESELVEGLIARGTVSWLFGIAVFEIIVHGKLGHLLPQRPRRFLVVQQGATHALYLCGTAEDAFATADILESEQQVPTQLAHNVPLPKGAGFRFGRPR